MLRETLAVLLERDCRLQFFNPGTVRQVAAPAPDVAVLATSAPGRLIDDLARYYPTVPIVRVQVVPEAAPSRAAESCGRMTIVPLEPHAIRNAVMARLADGPDATLHAVVRAIVDALHAELVPALAALRVAARQLGQTNAARAALVDSLRQHSAVASAVGNDLLRFQARPRDAARSADFGAAVCRELAERDAAADVRRLHGCQLDTSVPLPPGPVGLAPLISSVLHRHLSRRTNVPVVRATAGRRGVRLSYPRPSAQSASGLLALRLIGLILPPSGWSLEISRTAREEIISLSPGASALRGAA